MVDIVTNVSFASEIFWGAGQSAAGYDIKPQAAMDMLSTCDGRLQALMAEANLLGETTLSQGEASPDDAELRQAFASTLIESGMMMHTHTALSVVYHISAACLSTQQVKVSAARHLLF